MPPPRAQFAPCAAAQLTGSPGKPILATGLFSWYRVLSHAGTAPCTLNGGPNGVVGIRGDGGARTLAAGMTTTGAGWFGDLVGPRKKSAGAGTAKYGWEPQGTGVETGGVTAVSGGCRIRPP